jgi:hypothetical protein
LPGLVAVLLLASPAGAAPLLFDFIFSTEGTVTSGPEGLAVAMDPVSGLTAIFVSEGDVCDAGSCDIHVYTDPMGTGNWALSRTFQGPAGRGAVRGLDALPNGNLLIASTATTRVTEISPLNGAIVPMGIDLLLPIPVGSGGVQLETAVFVPSSFFADGIASFYVADEEGLNEAGRIYRFDTSGNAVNLPGQATNNFLFGQVVPMGEVAGGYDDPGAMAFDPVRGVLYISDDSSGQRRSRSFEYDLSGNLVDFSDLYSQLTATVPLCTTNPQGSAACDDPEGLAFLQLGGDTFVLAAFEDQERVAGFQIVPEPGSLALALLGLAGLSAAGRRQA